LRILRKALRFTQAAQLVEASAHRLAQLQIRRVEP
jgi:hypothetical protein